MRLACCNSFVLFLALPVLAWPQQADVPEKPATQPDAQPAPQVPPLTLRPAVEPTAAKGRINLDVVVTDKSGKPVSGLELKDFTLLDDKQPAKILSFRSFGGTAPSGGPPVEITLLLDTVNLGFGAVARTRLDIGRFLRQNGGHLAHPVSIFGFSDGGVKVLSQPSMDGTALAAQLDQSEASLRALRRSEGVYGAIERFQLSIRSLMAIAQSESKWPGRKLLIWVGPGWPMFDSPNIDTSSKDQQQLFASIVQLSTTLRESHISLYSVSMGDPGVGTYLYKDFLKGVPTAEKANPSNLSLKVLAIQSGGRVLNPDNDLTAQIDSCVQDAGAFYTLSFDPPRADKPDEYHDLKIVVSQSGLTARTNAGYYNQP
jgi:VWFA-related protein